MKKMTKFFSLTMVILMLISVLSLNAFGFENDYMTIECPENYDEDDWSEDDSFYVDVLYSEYVLDENGDEYYTDNTVNIYATSCWDDTLETYYDEENLEFLAETYDDVTGKTMYYATFGGYDAVVYDIYYTYTGSDENGKRVVKDCLYSEVTIVTDRTSITMYFDIWEADDLTVCRNDMAELFLDGMTINAEKVIEAEKGEKTIAIVILAVIIGGAIIGLIVVIIFIVHSVKKPKNNQVYNNAQPQMYNPYANMVPQMVNNQGNEKTEVNTYENVVPQMINNPEPVKTEPEISDNNDANNQKENI